MTITGTTTRMEYSGNDATTVFPYTFRIFADADLVVTLISAAGAETTIVLTTHYTVSGADSNSGGNVTMLTAPATGESLVITRSLAATQSVDFRTQGPTRAETLERALDRLTLLVQQEADDNDRALILTPGSVDGEGEYDANGNTIGNLTAGSLSTDAVSKGQMDTAIAGVTAGSYNPVTATGATTAQTLESRFAETKIAADYAGADWGAKVAAAIADAVAGDVIDARTRFSGTLAMASNLTIAATGLTILLPSATLSTANRIIVAATAIGTRIIGPTMHGLGGGCSVQYSGTGTFLTTGDNVTNLTGIEIRNLLVQVTSTSGSPIGIALLATTLYRLDDVRVILPVNANAIGVLLDGTGYFTGHGVLTNLLVNNNTGTGVKLTGSGVNSANHNTWIGGDITGTATTGKGFVADSNSHSGNQLMNIDIESQSVGVEDGRGSFLISARFEGCTVDISELATVVTANVILSQTGSGTGGALIVQSARTNNNQFMVLEGRRRTESMSANLGDAGSTCTLVVGQNPIHNFSTAALTANRTVTLSTTGAVHGDIFTWTRIGLGAFTLDFSGLKTIPSATAARCTAMFDGKGGSVWRLMGYELL